MIAQKVAPVKIAEDTLPEIPVRKAFNKIYRRIVESCSDFSTPVVPCEFHPFLEVSHRAFDTHRPLVLSPDIIWLTIAQGIAAHINANAEALRHKFVDFDGKQEIEVRHDGLIKGVLENDWTTVFHMFSDEIKERIGEDNHNNIVGEFSTTGLVEKAANEIILMDAVQSYFDFSVRTCCGIPEIILEGAAEDYKEICHKANKSLKEYDLDWWAEDLIPRLEEIAHSAEGHENPEFWKDWYKINGGSGGPYINGHAMHFFPYIQRGGDLIRNSYIGQDDLDRSFMNGIHTNDAPKGLSQVPFKWKYFSNVFPMIFIAGFIGLEQDKDTKALRPKIGWAVMDKDAPKDPDFFGTCTKCGQEKENEYLSVHKDNPKDIICGQCRNQIGRKKGYNAVWDYVQI